MFAKYVLILHNYILYFKYIGDYLAIFLKNKNKLSQTVNFLSPYPLVRHTSSLTYCGKVLLCRIFYDRFICTLLFINLCGMLQNEGLNE